MSWHLIRDIFPDLVKYEVDYKATDYQTMVTPYYLNSVFLDNVFRDGDSGLVELKVTLAPSPNTSPFAPKALINSLVPVQMLGHLKEFNSRYENNNCFLDLKFVIAASTIDQVIMEMYKESFENRFTEELEIELTKSE